jgi:hypothetical protein
MDLRTAFIGLIIIGICVIPFVMINYYRLKKEKKMLKSLSDIAKQQHCVINKYEICGEYVIGIDEKTNFIFFFQHQEEKEIAQFVNLNEILFCEILKKTRAGTNESGNLLFIERVELLFKFKNTKRAAVHLELFDEEINIQIRQELEFAEKWAKYFNERIENIP